MPVGSSHDHPLAAPNPAQATFPFLLPYHAHLILYPLLTIRTSLFLFFILTVTSSTMAFARRSLRGMTTAARSFRTAPVSRPGQLLGRRFYSSGKGYEEHTSSDLPWYAQLASIESPSGKAHLY